MRNAKDLIESDTSAEEGTNKKRPITAHEIMERLYEDSTEVAPAPTKPKEPLTKPMPKPKKNPWKRDIKPGESPRPKACEALEEAKKKKNKGQVAPSPGKVGYGKKKVKESLARRLLDS